MICYDLVDLMGVHSYPDQTSHNSILPFNFLFQNDIILTFKKDIKTSMILIDTD